MSTAVSSQRIWTNWTQI